MRSRPFRRSAVLTALALTGFAGTAESQSVQRFSLQGSGAALFATKDDPNFDSKTGLGFEVQARYTFSRFSIGAGYQRSTVFSSPTLDLNLSLSLGFIEPRYVLAAGSTVAVYLAGRLGAGKLVCSETCQAQETNLSYGGGGGLLFKLSRRLSADLGAQYFQVSGDLSSGYAMVRAGLGIGL
jgi:opacity protein-like surface antigen